MLSGRTGWTLLSFLQRDKVTSFVVPSTYSALTFLVRHVDSLEICLRNFRHRNR